MKRREFITLIGSSLFWASVARAQQREKMRRIGVLLPATADDAVFQIRLGAFLQGLQQAGWTIGSNVRIETRWASSNSDNIRKQAAELGAFAPDVILAFGASTVGPLLHVTRLTIPPTLLSTADEVIE